MAKAYGAGAGKQITSRLESLSQGSFLNRLANRIIDFLARVVGNSAVGRFFKRYKNPAELFEKSVFHTIFVKKPSAVVKRIKGFVAYKYEESVFLAVVDRLSFSLMSLSLMSYGLLLLLFGLGLVTISVVRYAAMGALVLVDDSMVTGAIFALGGAVLVFSKQSLAQGVVGSRAFRFIFIDILGIRKDTLPLGEKPVRRFFAPILLGGGLSLFSFVVPVKVILLGAVAVLFVCAVLKSCEVGTLAIVVALPFLPTMMLVAICVLTLASFLFKLLCGKRIIRMDFLDFFVILFSAMLLYGGFDSLIPGSSVPRVLVYLAYMSSYFVIVNTMRTASWSRKMVGGLIVAGLLSALMGIYQNFIGMESTQVWLDTEMFGDITTRVIGPFDNPNVFGEYLIMLLPLCAAVFFTQRGSGRILPLVAFIIMGGALIYTNSRGAWLGFLLSFALFLMMYSRAFIKLMLVGIAALPFIPALLPETILNRFLSIGNLADTSTAYRVSIWQGSGKIIESFWASGVGVGSDVFSQVYQPYALSGAAYALHSHNLYMQIMIELGIGGIVVFISMLLVFCKMVISFYSKVKEGPLRVMAAGLMCGVLAFLIQGLTDNVWYNLRIFLMFWVCIAVASGLRRSYYTETGADGFGS